MRKLAQFFYRITLKNRFIRWIWLLALGIFGVRMATERGLAWRKDPSVKTVFSIAPNDIASFKIGNIQRDEIEEITFVKADSVWLVVKNNVTVRVPNDSVQRFLNVFPKIESVAVRKLSENPQTDALPIFEIFIFDKNGAKHSFSIVYEAKDSVSNELLTFIKLPNERFLQGVRGDLTSVFRCNFDDFRNRKILNFPTAAATSLTVEMPNDTFFFNRIDTIWRCQKPARTTIIQHFVFKNRLENLDILRGQNFYDHDHDLLTPPKIIAKWTLRTPTDSTILTVFQLDRNVVLHSSANEKSYFQFDSLTSVLPDLQAILLKK